MWRKYFPILLIVFPNLLALGIAIPAFGTWFDTLVNGMWIDIAVAVALALWILNMLLMYTTKWEPQRYALWNLILKASHVGFYAVMILMIIAQPYALLLMLWPLGMVTTATGQYGLRALTLTRGKPGITKMFSVGNIFVCYLPGFDIIGAVLIYLRVRKLKEETT